MAGSSLSQKHPKSLHGSAPLQGSQDPYHNKRAASKAGRGPHATRTPTLVKARQGRDERAGAGGCGRTAGRERGGTGQPRKLWPDRCRPRRSHPQHSQAGELSSPRRHLCGQHKDPFSSSRCDTISSLPALKCPGLCPQVLPSVVGGSWSQAWGRCWVSNHLFQFHSPRKGSGCYSSAEAPCDDVGGCSVIIIPD